MPSLSFSVFKEILLSGSKCQTIRKPRKRPLKVGDKLYVFWKLRTKECERLGISKITNIVHKKVWQLTETDALLDGFKPTDLYSAHYMMEEWFRAKYGERNFQPSMEIEVISFEPLKKPVGVEFGTFEEFWKYCHGGCPDSKEGCAETCGLRRKLKIHPFGSFKWKGEIPKND